MLFSGHPAPQSLRGLIQVCKGCFERRCIIQQRCERFRLKPTKAFAIPQHTLGHQLPAGVSHQVRQSSPRIWHRLLSGSEPIVGWCQSRALASSARPRPRPCNNTLTFLQGADWGREVHPRNWEQASCQRSASTGSSIAFFNSSTSLIYERPQGCRACRAMAGTKSTTFIEILKTCGLKSTFCPDWAAVLR